MKLKAWLDGGRGRSSALAVHLGVSQGRVTQIASDGVPVKYMVAVRDFTGSEVTLEEMVAAKAATTVPSIVCRNWRAPELAQEAA